MIMWGREGDEKHVSSYMDLLREDFHVRKMKMWTEINREHALEGCPLIPAEDGSFAGACVLHGYNPNSKPLTYEQWMRFGQMDNDDA